ncbi:transporter [Alcanivoracaceae bacterium MT1]
MPLEPSFQPPGSRLIHLALTVALLAPAATTLAAESFRFRQAPIGLFGGEIAVNAKPRAGFFGTVTVNYAELDDIAGPDGGQYYQGAQTIPVPTATLTGGAVPDGTYRAFISDSAINFYQELTRVNLVLGYQSNIEIAGGRLAFGLLQPFVKGRRHVSASDPQITFSEGTPQNIQDAVTPKIREQVEARMKSMLDRQNQHFSGPGDTNLSMAWVRKSKRLKLVTGLSVVLPTGEYETDRAPNPGQGDFYTVKPTMAFTYSLAEPGTGSALSSGVTFAGRLTYGYNTENKDTNYQSGQFVFAELAAAKVTGNWAFGANVMTLRQVTDDRDDGQTVSGNRYRNYAAGPFIAYKFPGRKFGLNLNYSRNFSAENAITGEGYMLRLIKVW